MINERKISILLILTCVTGIARSRFDQLHRFIIFDEEKEDSHSAPGNGHQTEGMPPAPMLGHEAADTYADSDAKGNRNIPETHHAGTFFRRKQPGEHGRTGGGIPGLADTDAGAGHQQLGEGFGEGAGQRGQLQTRAMMPMVFFRLQRSTRIETGSTKATMDQ